ncbi:MAG: nucleotide exchange factor GrpE [Chloroflexota bacterium]|nr:nucleotide exchange factor GrpE [Chloroflexota bacterium]
MQTGDERDDRRQGQEPAEAAAAADAAPPAAEAPADGDDELARARVQAAEYEDRWKRSAAEFINYKRRTEQERGDLLRGANAALILELLPVLDDLERALANVPADESASPWVEGVRLVERKFRAILERQGLTPIAALGQRFDPAVHEAVAGSGQVVTQEYQRGYRLHGRTLRPAMVVVGEAAESTEAAPVLH